MGSHQIILSSSRCIARSFSPSSFAQLVQGNWEPCGAPSGCYCSRPVLHQIHCRNITVFPIFEEHIKPGVVTVSVRNSEVAGFPPFKQAEWDRLNHITFADNPLLSCTAIAELRRPGLRIVSDCDCSIEANLPKTERECPTCKEGYYTCQAASICLASLLILIFTILGGVGFILYTLIKQQRQS